MAALAVLICPICKEEFKSSRSWAKFCSTKCRNIYHTDKKYIEKGEIPGPKCPYCKTDDPKMFELMRAGHYLCNVCVKEFDHE